MLIIDGYCPSVASMDEVEATLAVARPHEVLESLPATLTLRVLGGEDRGRMFTVHGPVVTAGREQENKKYDKPVHPILLKDRTVSVAHFELRWTHEGILLRDLGSTNGTWVGRAQLRPLTEAVYLYPGTEKCAGSTFRAGTVAMELISQRQLPRAVSTSDRLGELIGGSLPMRQLYSLMERIAPTPLDVLICGETGTGKGAIARTIHELSGRKGHFVTLDCTLLNRELAEAAIMGHSKGAFTGAVGERIGFFEEAHGGTLFIDELGELSPELQSKLLRVIDDKEIIRVGETTPRKVDIRIICATNRSLPKEVAQGRFRQDLFHRVWKANIQTTPLRHRKEDIPILAEHFLREVTQTVQASRSFSTDALQRLQELEWMGNVRELINFVEFVGALATTAVIHAEDLEHFERQRNRILLSSPDDRTVSSGIRFDLSHKEARRHFSRVYCAMLMNQYNGNVRMAAEHAGLTPQGFRKLLSRLEADPSQDEDD